MSKLTIWERIAFIPKVLKLFLNTEMTAFQFVKVTTGITFVIVIFCALLSKCTSSTEVHATANKKEETPVKHEFTVDQALDAVVRTVSADQVCYDSAQNSYLMHWTRHQITDSEDKEEHDKERDGWYSMTDVTMYRTANDTWYIKDVNSIPDVYVGVDVTGLPCKPGVGH